MNLVSGSRRGAAPIIIVDKKGWPKVARGLSKVARAWANSTGFVADFGEHLLVPGRRGEIHVVYAAPPKNGHAIWTFAALAARLPVGRYFLAVEPGREEATDVALGWALGGYEFRKYKTRGSPRDRAELLWPEAADRAQVERLFRAITFGRDLINTPAEDMGPAELAEAAENIARRHGASVRVIVGESLLAENYPMIHAVGRASHRPPRLIDLRWGKTDAPRVTLVGKGVCFDSGGLDLKSSSAMQLMKKDMGGAATVLALADAVMDAGLPIRLRVLVPAVDNAVSGNAYRPLDVLRTRKGLTVEVTNTDAEGRLILADALAEADAERPAVLIDVATLTGAARVALGPDVPALFCNDEPLAADLLRAAEASGDRLWRMPLWDGYRSQLDSKVADLVNASSSPHAGAITAALFLREFVSATTPWIHIDTMAWNIESRPGRPVGGETMGLRALYRMLCERYPAGRSAKAPRSNKR
ncbi:MAG: leucyl aminopeptidase family protein [Myxococcales bacterium]|nr:leucyl aminopeptidase family protein [Myxococcales bacterium]